MSSEIRPSVSRRGMLRLAGVLAAGASLASVSPLIAQAAEEEVQLTPYQLQDAQDTPQTILNIAATAEALAITHYHAALTGGGLGLSAEERVILQASLDSEVIHLEFLMANGAQLLTDKFFVRPNAYTNRAVFIQQTDDAEVIFVAAYLAATRRFAELGNPRLAATAAQTACVEQSHKALIRGFAPDLIPNNVSLAQPILYNVSDAVPMAAPFLFGAEGMVGPFPFPGVDEARRVVGDADVLVVPPFTMVF